MYAVSYTLKERDTCFSPAGGMKARFRQCSAVMKLVIVPDWPFNLESTGNFFHHLTAISNVITQIQTTF